MAETSLTMPRGIALVRIETPLGRVLVWSDKLTVEELRLARAVAGHLSRCGSRAVVLTNCEVEELLTDAA